MAVVINTSELMGVLEITPRHHNIMLAGRHGIGKSRIITEYFTSKGQKVVTLFLGQMSDPGDIIGLPALNDKTGKTEFRLPWWFPEDGKPLVLFLDELNRARPEILQCVMDLTLNKAIVGRKLPEGTQIISAVNEGEEYQLTDLDPALISRFNIYTFAPTVSEWLLWAEKTGLDKRVIDFISKKPQFLDGEIQDGLTKSADRRAWERVSEIVRSFKKLDGVTEKTVAGVVGNSAAVSFMYHCRNRTGLSPIDVLNNFEAELPSLSSSEPHELTTLNESCFRLIEAEKNKKIRKKYTVNFAKYTNWLHSEQKREVLAHWTTLFDADTYPFTKISLLSEAPEIMSIIEQYIKDIQL
ncbi:MAG: AAA family ATPase [Clostridiales bacterium]|jgi:hypothetical protein|nr:AAA family ATPase [Clostridiales bacterium]